MKQIYNKLLDISAQESARGTSVFPGAVTNPPGHLPLARGCCYFISFLPFIPSVFPACSLNGNPSVQRFYFAVQACQGVAQVRQLHCVDIDFMVVPFPPSGKALLDVVVLGSAEQSPPVKDLLPLLGALKHMSCWHAAKITVVTQNTTGWQKVVSNLSAVLIEPADLESCIDHREAWRGALVIREKKYVSELRFDGFSLRSPVHQISGSSLLQAPPTTADHKLQSEVFHYYTPVLDLVQMVNLADLPGFLLSRTQFELGLSVKSVKAKLMLDQLRSLHGKVGALFSLSCIITPIAQRAASQLSSQRWREAMAKRPKSLPVPDVEVKGESAQYFLLVQGPEDDGCGACRVRMLLSDSQINGAAAMATVSELLRFKSLSSSGTLSVRNILCSLPCLQGHELLKRERKVTQVQKLVLREYLRHKEETSGSTSIPVNDLKAILNLARKQYLQMIDSKLPSTASCLQTVSHLQCEWPERSVLHNIEYLQRRRQKRRFGLLGPVSSDNLLGPKDIHKGSPALLDARELLKHFTSDGLPVGELQPLVVNRVNNVFQLSPDLSPGRISLMPFKKASESHYHGIEFCLDNQRSLDRDQAFVKLQSRLIRYETQTTCSKEPCALPFALSPAPSPAVMSEPGSVPDGETLQNADVARLKRKSWDMEVIGGYPRKRLVKSESSDSLCSQSSGSSGTHIGIRSLRQQTSRSQSASSSNSHSSSSATRQMLLEVVAKTLKHHGISAGHKCFEACSKRLFDISKFYLKDLKTSRGLHDEMKKAAGSNVKQVIDWVLEKNSMK
uniref:MDM2 binding protein n=1 Tax=Mola mola TaxID=94237 RepID=A0A3Q4B1N6_MOLML